MGTLVSDAIESGPSRSHVDDPPPLYTRHESQSNSQSHNNKENGDLKNSSDSHGHSDSDWDLSCLKEYDLVFLVDDSASMAGSRWARALRALQDVADRVQKFDEDGIDIHFLNAVKKSKTNLKNRAAVQATFRDVKPNGGTPLGKRIKDIAGPKIKAYERYHALWKVLKGSAPRKCIMVVITDGKSTDTVDEPLFDMAAQLDKVEAPKDQLGIQFVQIGSDVSCSAFLTYLDNKFTMDNIDTSQLNKNQVEYLQGRAQAMSTKMAESGKTPRDMIDTTPYQHDVEFDAELLTKVMLGSVDRGFDAMTRWSLLPTRQA